MSFYITDLVPDESARLGAKADLERLQGLLKADGARAFYDGIISLALGDACPEPSTASHEPMFGPRWTQAYTKEILAKRKAFNLEPATASPGRVARVSIELDRIREAFDEYIWDQASDAAGFSVSEPQIIKESVQYVDGELVFDVSGYNEQEEQE